MPGQGFENLARQDRKTVERGLPLELPKAILGLAPSDGRAQQAALDRAGANRIGSRLERRRQAHSPRVCTRPRIQDELDHQPCDLSGQLEERFNAR
jgi:hypothetical protein